MLRVFCIFIVFFCVCSNTWLTAQTTSVIVDTNVTLIDGAASPFNQVQAGDTIFFEPGPRKYIYIRNFSGKPGKPFVFCNHNGVVSIDTDHYFGILFSNCRYVKLTGAGDQKDFYGFRIERVGQGGGLSIGEGSSDAEIEHVFIANTHIAAIYAKTDPDCSFNFTREHFTQYNTIIHDCYLTQTGNEGMYIGSSKYLGQVVTCNGSDTLLMPSLLDGVKIYNNIFTYNQWDAIQISSASDNCDIHDNIILFDSQEAVFNQMSGVMIGGGSKCNCFNNYIAMGKGVGIESHGLGGYAIFNNVIVNAGLNYFPSDLTKMKHGIFMNDFSSQTDSSFTVVFNTIVSPKSDGIRYHCHNTKNDLIASNAIINPGNFDYYEHGNFSVKGKDSYIMVLDTPTTVNITHNFFDRTPDAAMFADSLFRLRGVSPLIDKAYPDTRGITFDFDHKTRPYGKASDIGAFEYQKSDTVKPDPGSNNFLLYPNPVRNIFYLFFELEDSGLVNLDIYNLGGKLVLSNSYPAQKKGSNVVNAGVSSLSDGIYLYVLRGKKKLLSGKFVKQ
jgi:hypothetical protein